MSEKSYISVASAKRLAQPKTVSYQRIHDCIVRLQQQFRKSRSERGSFPEHESWHGDADQGQQPEWNRFAQQPNEGRHQHYPSATPGQ